VGPAHAGTRVVLVQDAGVRIVHAATGEVSRELVLNPTERYREPDDDSSPSRSDRPIPAVSDR
jgi:hypothetical protein